MLHGVEKISQWTPMVLRYGHGRTTRSEDGLAAKFERSMIMKREVLINKLVDN